MPAGFALCGFRYSSSAGQSSIGLDDLSMNERGRSRGMGAGLMRLRFLPKVHDSPRGHDRC
eukprot:2283502-Rhodomonas_salina.3